MGFRGSQPVKAETEQMIINELIINDYIQTLASDQKEPAVQRDVLCGHRGHDSAIYGINTSIVKNGPQTLTKRLFRI